MTGISVGQLLNMEPGLQDRAISGLSEKSRLRLAHLASLGMEREMLKALSYRQVIEKLTTTEDMYKE